MTLCVIDVGCLSIRNLPYLGVDEIVSRMLRVAAGRAMAANAVGNAGAVSAFVVTDSFVPIPIIARFPCAHVK